MGNSYKLLLSLLCIVIGVLLYVLPLTPFVKPDSDWIEILQTIGILIIGVGLGPALLTLPQLWKQYRSKQKIDSLLMRTIRIKEPAKKRPAMFLADIEGCITPANRVPMDVSKVARLRAYFSWLHTDAGKEYPPVVICTGRSQGYAECIAQILSIDNMDLPFIIENGTALYYPLSRRVVVVLNSESRKKIEEVRSILVNNLPKENVFEPKSYCITINATTGQSIADLRKIIDRILANCGKTEDVNISETTSAVDITPEGYDKATPIKNVIDEFENIKHRRINMSDVVSIVDSDSDLPVVQVVGKSYSPIEGSDKIRKACGDGYVIDLPATDFVTRVIEIECGIEIK